jgi:glycosyltransferase involved in cell wall biosynthesis
MTRVLVCSEFTKLNTGYAVYCKELLTRLSKHFEVAEFATYCDPIDHQAEIKEIPWKIYPNLPNRNNQAEVSAYNSDHQNVFGKWKFEDTVLKFKPHVVIAINDFWMSNWINESPLRKYFNFVWMVPCDSYPQHEEWVDNFAQCDGIMTYTHWSKNILESHGLKVYGVTSPGKNDIFKALNKTNIKKNFGLEDKIVIGTVMRNQKRKLFPDLFEGFRKFLDKTKRNDVVLYCHTSYPDVGWDLPKLLIQHGISSKVLFTYICKNCGLSFPLFYNDIVTPCLRCKKGAKLANVNNGLTPEQLCVVYNTFDLYIQPATIEGFGIPIVEAASCGIPIAATNFSAMEELTSNLSGYKIDYCRLSLEQETGRYVPTVSVDSIAQIIEEFTDLPEMIRLRKGFLTQQAVEKYYNWTHTEMVWLAYLNQIDTKKYDALWKEPPHIQHPNLNIPNNLNNAEFVKWAIVNILGKPGRIASEFEAKLLKQLNFGITTSHFLMGYTEDLSMFGRPDVVPFNRDQCIQYLLKIVEKQNFWESRK